MTRRWIASLSSLATAFKDNKIKRHLQLYTSVQPRELFPGCWFRFQITSLQTHKKVSFCIKSTFISLKCILCSSFFWVLRFFVVTTVRAGKCNIIRRRKMNYYLIYRNIPGDFDRVRLQCSVANRSAWWFMWCRLEFHVEPWLPEPSQAVSIAP